MPKRFRKTKVIATIGPACNTLPMLEAMINAGMNVARLNMSHGDEKSHTQTLARIRQAAKTCNATIAIMIDTRGREIRTTQVVDGEVFLERHQSFNLYMNDHLGDANGVSLTYPRLHQHAEPGHRILLDDGQIELIVEKVGKTELQCLVECGGILRNNKGVNLPDTFSAVGDVEYDSRNEVKFAAEHGVDFVAASFIRNAEEVQQMRLRLREYGADIPIIAKIENREGVDNIEEIISVSNGIMVARGDLGVELSMGEGPTIQKRIIRATVSNGKPVITATQMLDSMERNPRPTRAEVSDVANAIFDGSSAVMLSGETATGSRPVETVKTMVGLALEAEQSLREFGHLQQIKPNPTNEAPEAVAQATITMANHLQAAAIVSLTETGLSPRLISKYRPDYPILALTSSPEVARRLAMSWGIYSIVYDEGGSDEDRVKFAVDVGRKLGQVNSGDVLILTAGSSGQAGSTNLIRIVPAD
ncbi:MAG: pyruvate kinase [Gammaproteobacteria bacterium]|nr:pyruvate kinase [Gammaproteobacteria bacterium]